MFHHQQNFDETGDPCSGLSVADITLYGAEMEKRISLRPTESVADTADLDGIANTGYMETSVIRNKVRVFLSKGARDYEACGWGLLRNTLYLRYPNLSKIGNKKV